VIVAAAIGIGRRRRAFNQRRAAATTPDARALLAWEEAEEALALAGYPRKRAETPAEYARRIPGRATISPGPMTTLAGATAAAAYSETGIAPGTQQQPPPPPTKSVTNSPPKPPAKNASAGRSA
jgi:hypothetical protein